MVDPSNSHSVASVRVLENPVIPARELLAFSRVQNHVAKNAMFIYRDENSSRSTSTETAAPVTDVGIRTITFNFLGTSART